MQSSKGDSDSDAENNKYLLNPSGTNNNNIFHVGETDSSADSDCEDLSEDAESFSSDDPVIRPLEDCKMIFDLDGAKALNDAEILTLIEAKHIAAYQLEKAVGDLERAVSIR